MSLRTRLLVTLVPAMLMLFLVLFQLAFTTSRSILEEQIRRESLALAEVHAGEFELLFETARTIAQDLALAVADDADLEPERIENRIRTTLKHHRCKSVNEGRTGLGPAANR